MNNTIIGALAGTALGLVLIAAEYLLVRAGAAERARRKHAKTELDDAERKRIRTIAVFCLWLPPAFAALSWLIFT